MNLQAAPLMQSPPGAFTTIDGRQFLYFVGTGYLGLQGRAEVIQAACDAARQYGVGSATTRTGYGTTPPLLEVERLTAELTGAEDALYLPSGYASSQVAAAALADACDAVGDRRVFPLLPLRSGPGDRSADVPLRPCDAAALRTVLAEKVKPGQRPLVLTDGVFAGAATLRRWPLTRRSSAIGPARRCWLTMRMGWACWAARPRNAGARRPSPYPQ